MNDAHLSLYWTEAHEQFSADLDRGLLRLGHLLARRFQRRQIIGRPYAAPAARPVDADAPTSPTARAALAGLMACVATAALLATVATLATAGAAHGAPLHAATLAGSAIVAPAMLA